MALSTWLLLLVAHPLEFRTLLQYRIYHDQKRDITAPREHATSGWDRASMRRCWEFLDMTSRSFSTVIKELEGDLARVICLFYLVLRGLDTIEDDMTLPLAIKLPLLRDFHVHTVTPGWAFTGSGPNERDAQLLVEYAVVVDELLRLPPAYRDAILTIAAKMGAGMADFVARAATLPPSAPEEKIAAGGIDTIADYDLYCHYVAGLVGEGLSLIFAASGKERPELAAERALSNSMGLLLQKTNITRDVREDDGGYAAAVSLFLLFHPSSAAAAYSAAYASPVPGTPNPRWVQSAMVLDALRHAPDALDYLRLLRNQSVFNFCAIPATMAIATLELCFGNERMMRGNVKIRKAVAAELIMRSTNPREVGLIFREYARRIHARAVPADPSYVRISVACGKIEQWCEHYYPSFVLVSAGSTASPTQSIDPADARGRTFLLSEKRDQALSQKLRIEALRAGGAVGAVGQRHKAQEMQVGELALYVGGALLLVAAVCAGVVWLIMQMAD
ncbi:isoprenoid synthase domain-containing protein [Mycena rosella]|uniref:Squalene synthase n=1 Tax=Mycena rosella TaxID=1033263 RepID=A0AAD7GH64_MYCRO|nr:isoprenoid synthase domain-containing protein [Mycena rosella]